MHRAFTIVELLVVVSIIAILLALLTPALDTAMEMTRRVVCASRLDGFGQVHSQYALDNKRKLVDGWASTGAPGSHQNAIWSWVPNSSMAPYGQYREMGHLAKKRYIPKPRISLYCPDTPANLFNGSNSTEWPDDDTPEGKTQYLNNYIQYSYNYRNTIGATPTAGPFRPAKLSDPGSLTLHVDYFSRQDSRRTHLDGYSVSHLDGSVVFVYDSPDILKGIRYAFGSDGTVPGPMAGGPVGCANQEKAYRRFFDRPFDGRRDDFTIPADW